MPSNPKNGGKEFGGSLSQVIGVDQLSVIHRSFAVSYLGANYQQQIRPKMTNDEQDRTTD